MEERDTGRSCTETLARVDACHAMSAAAFRTPLGSIEASSKPASYPAANA
jgi:hypothetical protein